MADIRRLLETALFDTGGETVEGAFVDHWEANSSRALSELAEHFRRKGFSDADRALLLQLLQRDPPPSQLAALLRELEKWLSSIRADLLKSPAPLVRVGALQASAAHLSVEELAAILRDPAPDVRIAALDSLAQRRFSTEESFPLIVSALEDSDPRVRAHAVGCTKVLKFPAGGDALVRRYETEPETSVRRAILAYVAEAAYSAGIHTTHDNVRVQIGEPLTRLLLRELDHAEPDVRVMAARGLQRVGGDDVWDALLGRLAVETHREVILKLLDRQGYGRHAARSFDILAKHVHSNDDAVRVWATWQFEYVAKEKAVPFLRPFIGDPAIDRPVIMTLGKLGDPDVLPRVVERLSDPATKHYRREIESAIGSLVVYAWSRPHALTPELSRQIQSRIDALTGGWPISVAKANQAIPLHEAPSLYLWSLKSDGTVLVSDLDTAMNSTEPVTDPLTRFAVILRGCRRYPELTALLDPPKATTLCMTCLAIGRRGDFDCGLCKGLGWLLRG